MNPWLLVTFTLIGMFWELCRCNKNKIQWKPMAFRKVKEMGVANYQCPVYLDLNYDDVGKVLDLNLRYVRAKDYNTTETFTSMGTMVYSMVEEGSSQSQRDKHEKTNPIGSHWNTSFHKFASAVPIIEVSTKEAKCGDDGLFLCHVSYTDPKFPRVVHVMAGFLAMEVVGSPKEMKLLVFPDTRADRGDMYTTVGRHEKLNITCCTFGPDNTYLYVNYACYMSVDDWREIQHVPFLQWRGPMINWTTPLTPEEKIGMCRGKYFYTKFEFALPEKKKKCVVRCMADVNNAGYNRDNKKDFVILLTGSLDKAPSFLPIQEEWKNIFIPIYIACSIIFVLIIVGAVVLMIYTGHYRSILGPGSEPYSKYEENLEDQKNRSDESMMRDRMKRLRSLPISFENTQTGETILELRKRVEEDSGT